MWIVFEMTGIVEIKPISVPFYSEEEAISFRITMLQGTIYKNSRLLISYVKVLETQKQDICNKLKEKKRWSSTIGDHLVMSDVYGVLSI